MKKMLFVTSSYPFGDREASFIRPEIEKLSEKFDITLVSRNSVDEQTSQPPENVKVLRYESRKSYSVIKYILRTIFSPYIYCEIFKLVKSKRLSLAKIKKAIRFCMRSYHFADYLEDVRKEMGKEVVLYTYWNDYSVMALSLIKQSKDKLVSRAHRIDLYERKENNFYLPLKEISNKKTELIAFISKEGKEYFSKSFKTNAKKEVFYLGVKEQEVIDRKKENEWSVYSFSYVSPVKRIDRIIGALEKVPEEFEVKWTHIGNGKLYEEMLKTADAKLGRKKNISYNFVGAMENSEALTFIKEQEFALLINTSESEGIPVTMMEAMSFGIPVLGLDVGGVNEIIKNNENGYLLPADADETMISQTLISFLKMSAEKRQAMCKNAKDTWQESYDQDKNYKEFTQKIYNLE